MGFFALPLPAGALPALNPREAPQAGFVVDIAADELDSAHGGGDVDTGTSLREAILDANANGQADTISFGNVLNGARIRLTGGQLTVTDDLSIDASGLIVDGNNGSRILNISDGSAVVKNVTLSGLTLTRGNVAGAGGAISNRENLALSGCTIFDSNATGGSGNGGAIFHAGAALSISRSTITGNSAGRRGGWPLLRQQSRHHHHRLGLLEKSCPRLFRRGHQRRCWRHDDLRLHHFGKYRERIRRRNQRLSSHPGNLRFHHRREPLGHPQWRGHGHTLWQPRHDRRDGPLEQRLPSRGWTPLDKTPTNLTRGSIVGNTVGSYGGGGIRHDEATLTIVDSSISGNFSGNCGGGIAIPATGGSMAVSHSTIADNVAASDGGAIRASGGGVGVTVDSSTLSANQAATGGGIFASGATLSVQNSTLSGNRAGAGGGGGIRSVAGNDLTVENSTIARNHASGVGGGGLYADGAETLRSSIVSGNTLGGGVGSDISGAVEAADSNLLENPAGGHALVDGVAGNIVGRDPLLAPLAPNGGPTLTHALLPASPALDAGSNFAALLSLV